MLERETVKFVADRDENHLLEEYCRRAEAEARVVDVQVEVLDGLSH